MKRLFYLLSLCALLTTPACRTAKTDAQPNMTGSTNAPQSYYDNARRTVPPFLVVGISTDPTYGVTQKNPICVGGNTDNGARNQQRYLNALRGSKEGKSATVGAAAAAPSRPLMV